MFANVLICSEIEESDFEDLSSWMVCGMYDFPRHAVIDLERRS